MKDLRDKKNVFGFVGNVGTPTAAVALPLALERKMLFFGAFTGANLLRHDPPDRYVFNFRASYTEETAAVVRYLITVRHLRPESIAVFAQQDAFGDAGFAGVTRAVRELRPDFHGTLRVGYQRNTTDVKEAVATLKRTLPIDSHQSSRHGGDVPRGRAVHREGARPVPEDDSSPTCRSSAARRSRRSSSCSAGATPPA